MGLSRYLIVDVAAALLEQAPTRTDTEVRDLTEPRELDQQFDLLLAQFVLVHLEDLNYFFDQAVTYMHDDARLIVTHHLERHPYLHRLPGRTFRIRSYHHRFEDLEQAAQQAGLHGDYLDLTDHGAPSTRIYCFTHTS